MVSIMRGILLLTVMCAMAQASFLNTRPVPIGPPPGSEASLQSILDTVYGGSVNAATDQISDGVFAVSTQPGATIPVIIAEYAGLAATNALDICDYTDGVLGTCATVFDGADSAGDFTTLTWIDGPNSLKIGGPAGPTYNISSAAFVFALRTGANTFYSLDSLNPSGEARFVGYLGGPGAGAYTFGVEDQTDFDYNDFVFKIESITGAVPTVPNTEIPEPSTVALGGLGLAFVLAARLRRKRS